MWITSFFLPLPPVPTYCTSLELENRCSLSKIFIRGKSHMVRDQGNMLSVKGLEGNFRQEIWHQTGPVNRHLIVTHDLDFLGREILNVYNHQLRSCAELI
ncbi:hypothetical protein AVEN_39868-1 [Araneus ventricosus]|uniref:Uncharacterized protein n=1 Tax=Araneus ventricosus TaxID=182803 RepID=A0A4Y2NM91_ARAVE|nr:hypothetical protein AVEN_39868-1 [Araneus ventricosus]